MHDSVLDLYIYPCMITLIVTKQVSKEIQMSCDIILRICLSFQTRSNNYTYILLYTSYRSQKMAISHWEMYHHTIHFQLSLCRQLLMQP